MYLNSLSLFKLLVFGIAYLLNSTLFAEPNVSSEGSLTELKSNSSCFEIYTGPKKIGYALEVKSFNNEIHTSTHFTEFKIPKSDIAGLNKIPSNYENLVQWYKVESDENFTPLKSIFEISSNNNKAENVATTFKSTENKIISSTVRSEFKFKNSTSDPTKQKNQKPQEQEHQLGLVLESQMTDLLFKKRKPSQLSLKDKLKFQVFSENESKSQQVLTSVEQNSDSLILKHIKEGETFLTKHSLEGRVFEIQLKTSNIIFKPCTSKTVLTSLNSALNHKKFKTLFSFEDQEKIKKCCQHF